ncbi:glycosyl hydrolase family 61-domain-containing protein [Terfezia claveryi]|nr:glycosyl hydrolase family 61-domain-containing protein [Terfezia claveryi]
MKISILLATFTSAILVSAHGSIIRITIAGKEFPGNNPAKGNKNPDRIVWDYKDNGPVSAQDLQTNQIACSRNAKPAKSFGKAKAGDDVVVHWTKWSEYPPAWSISSDGKKGRWASDIMRESGMIVKLRIPPGIPTGKYVLRHELLALHGAQKEGSAQFYPVCANLEVEGNEGAKLGGEGVKFPGAYSSSDPGVDINIHKGVKAYVIPGPQPIEGGEAKKMIRGLNWIGKA